MAKRKFDKNNKNISDKVSNALQNFFNFGIDQGNQSELNRIYPVNKIGGKKEKKKFEPSKFPSVVQELYNEWMTKRHTEMENQSRLEMYQDQDMMYNNNALLARAMDLVADEVVQADSNVRIIGVDGKSEVQDWCLEQLDKWGMDKLIRPLAFDVTQYGDAGIVLISGENGSIEEVQQGDVYDLIDRIEFTPQEVKKELERTQGSRTHILNQLYQQTKVSLLIDAVLNDAEYPSYFKSYLFGFQINDFVLPPWRYIHFRNATPRSPFAPYGMPTFIRSVAPYRQYDMALTLQVIARGAMFPVDVYQLTVEQASGPTDQLELAIEFLNDWDNSGFNNTKKESFGVGERKITIKDVINYEQIVPNIQLGRVDDIEILRDDVIISTGLPRSFVDPNASTFGNSGVSLIQQFKPFARSVYNVQSVIMEGIMQMLRIQMIQTGKFDPYDTDFQLTMPYPESQTDRDLISSQSDLLRLANEVIDALGEKITGQQGAPLPIEVVRDIYHKLLPYDPERLDKWIDGVEKSKSAMQDNSNENSGDSFGFNEKEVKTKIKKLGYSVVKEAIDDSIRDCKSRAFSEGVHKNHHFYSSKIPYKDFNAKHLLEFKKNNVEKLSEELANKRQKIQRKVKK